MRPRQKPSLGLERPYSHGQRRERKREKLSKNKGRKEITSEKRTKEIAKLVDFLAGIGV